MRTKSRRLSTLLARRDARRRRSEFMRAKLTRGPLLPSAENSPYTHVTYRIPGSITSPWMKAALKYSMEIIK